MLDFKQIKLEKTKEDEQVNQIAVERLKMECPKLFEYNIEYGRNQFGRFLKFSLTRLTKRKRLRTYV